MLKNTFCHIPGVGAKRELQLWEAGVYSWEDLLEEPYGGLRLRADRRRSIQKCIEESLFHLDNENPDFFANLLPVDQHWRLFPHFRRSTVYLDIETTGMGGGQDHITSIALYDGKSIFPYVHGHNLSQFSHDVERYAVVITYNGKCFDVPFIQNNLGIRMHQVHIDLRYVLKSLGYGGGLKGCEKQLGIERDSLDGVDGFFAVLLWDEYRRNGNTKALETLLAYNILDAINLESLMVTAYNLKVQTTPFSKTHVLTAPERPPLPFQPDEATIMAIKQRLPL